MMQSRSSIKIALNRSTFLSLIIMIACALSNISQMSVFVDSGNSSQISIGVWMVAFVAVLLAGKKRLNIQASRLYVLTVLFFVLLSFNYFITGNNYWISSHVYSLFIVVFIFSIGCFLSDYVDEAQWKGIVYSYVISSGIVAIEVFLNYFSHGFDISSRIYAYDSKNSLSQILLTSIVLLMYGLNKSERKKYHILKIAIIIAMFILICMMKSRATLIGFVVLFVALLRDKSISRKVKYLISVLALAGVTIVIVNPVFNRLVVNDILFAGRSASNLNDLSSGRVRMIEFGIQQIKENLMWGIGNKYFDCYPLATILQFGIFPGIMLWVIALFPLFFGINSLSKSKELYSYKVTLIVLSITYAVNGLFEALSPLGPGVKCYFLWLLLGVLANKHFTMERSSSSYEP